MSGPVARASQAAKCALRLGSSDSPVTVDQYSRAERTASSVDLVGADLQVRRAGAAVEVQREVVRREDLAERHRRRVLVVGRHVAVVDAEVGQLGADERAERVVADAGDQRGAVAEPGGGHRDVGGAAAEELAERFDVLEADADLQGIDVDAAAPDGEYVERLRGSQDRLSGGRLVVRLAYDCALATLRPVNSLS